MKKTALTFVSFAISVALIHAQGGLISFFGPSAGVITNATPYAVGYPSLDASPSGETSPVNWTTSIEYYYVLLAATTTNAQDEGNPLGTDWSVVNYESGGVAYGTNFIVAGSVTGAGTGMGFASSLSAGTTYYDMVVGWSAQIGSTWAQIQLLLETDLGGAPFGFVGYSNIGTIDPVSSPAVGTPIFSPGSIDPGETILYSPLPEPATLALAGLGGLSMLLLRRRKS